MLSEDIGLWAISSPFGAGRVADIHYNYSASSNFFGIHKLMDEVREPINNYIDQIKEIIYLGHNEKAPVSKNILSESLTQISEFELLSDLNNLIDECLKQIEEEKVNIDSGSSKILDDIASHLLKYRGLITKSMKI